MSQLTAEEEELRRKGQELFEKRLALDKANGKKGHEILEKLIKEKQDASEEDEDEKSGSGGAEEFDAMRTLTELRKKFEEIPDSDESLNLSGSLGNDFSFNINDESMIGDISLNLSRENQNSFEQPDERVCDSTGTVILNQDKVQIDNSSSNVRFDLGRGRVYEYVKGENGVEEVINVNTEENVQSEVESVAPKFLDEEAPKYHYQEPIDHSTPTMQLTPLPNSNQQCSENLNFSNNTSVSSSNKTLIPADSFFQPYPIDILQERSTSNLSEASNLSINSNTSYVSAADTHDFDPSTSRKKLDRLKRRLEDCTRSVSSLSETQVTDKEALKELQNDSVLLNSLREENVELNMRIEEANNQIAILEEEKLSVERNVKQVNAEIQALKKNLSAVSSYNEKLVEELNKAEEIKISLEDENSRLQSEILRINQEKERMEEERIEKENLEQERYEALERNFAAVSASLETIRVELSSVQNEKDSLSNKCHETVESMKVTLQETTNKAVEHQQNFNDLSQKYKAEMEALQEKCQLIERQRISIARYEKSADNLEKELEATEERALIEKAELEEQNRKLNQQLTQMKTQIENETANFQTLSNEKLEKDAKIAELEEQLEVWQSQWPAKPPISDTEVETLISQHKQEIEELKKKHEEELQLKYKTTKWESHLEISRLRLELEKANIKLEQVQGEAKNYQEKFKSENRDLAILQEHTDALEKRLDELLKENGRVKRDNEEKETELFKLRENSFNSTQNSLEATFQDDSTMHSEGGLSAIQECAETSTFNTTSNSQSAKEKSPYTSLNFNNSLISETENARLIGEIEAKNEMVKELRNEIFLLTEELENERDQLKKSSLDQEDVLQRLNEANEKHSSEVNQLEKKIERLNYELEGVKIHNLNRSKNNSGNVDLKDYVNREDYNQLQANFSVINNNADHLRRKLLEESGRSREAENIIKEKEARLREQQEAVKEIKSHYNSAENKIKSMQRRLELAETNAENLKQEICEKEIKIEQVEEMLRNESTKCNVLESQVKDVQDKLGKAQVQIGEKNNVIAEMRNSSFVSNQHDRISLEEYTNLGNQLVACQQELVSRREKEEELATTVKYLSKQVKEEKENLCDAKSSLEFYKNELNKYTTDLKKNNNGYNNSRMAMHSPNSINSSICSLDSTLWNESISEKFDIFLDECRTFIKHYPDMKRILDMAGNLKSEVTLADATMNDSSLYDFGRQLILTEEKQFFEEIRRLEELSKELKNETLEKKLRFVRIGAENCVKVWKRQFDKLERELELQSRNTATLEDKKLTISKKALTLKASIFHGRFMRSENKIRFLRAEKKFFVNTLFVINSHLEDHRGANHVLANFVRALFVPHPLSAPKLKVRGKQRFIIVARLVLACIRIKRISNKWSEIRHRLNSEEEKLQAIARDNKTCSVLNMGRSILHDTAIEATLEKRKSAHKLRTALYLNQGNVNDVVVGEKIRKDEGLRKRAVAQRK